MKFREFIQSDAIVASLRSTDRDGAIRELVTAMGASGAISPDAVESIVTAMIAREKSGTTGFGRGVAAPHCKLPQISSVAGTVGLSAQGINFNALDGKPVYAIFMLLSPQGQDQQHLQAMEVIFRSLKEDTFRKLLRQADNRQKLVDLLDEADAR